VISPLARKRNLDFSAGNTAGNQRKMPSRGAPVIVRVGVRIAVRVADVVRIRVHTFVRVAIPVRVWCMTLSLQQQSILLLVQTDRLVCWWKCICKNLVSIWWSWTRSVDHTVSEQITTLFTDLPHSKLFNAFWPGMLREQQICENHACNLIGDTVL